jgi:hypothetical protein
LRPPHRLNLIDTNLKNKLRAKIHIIFTSEQVVWDFKGDVNIIQSQNLKSSKFTRNGLPSRTQNHVQSFTAPSFQMPEFALVMQQASRGVGSIDD